MAAPEAETEAAGGAAAPAATHQPVLPDEVGRLLAPRSGERLVDGTVGGGGHAARLLELSAPDGRLLGLDWDETALAAAAARLASFGARARLVRANFAELERVLGDAGFRPADVLLFDLGLSAFHVDEAGRGFSFRRAGPLDMRMDRRDALTAGRLLAELDEPALADLIFRLGEERASRRIARALVAAREAGELTDTLALAEVVRRAVRRSARGERSGPERVDPATRTFQALRLAVNREPENLAALLEVLPRCLAPGGRVGIIAFHSLEDRPVKQRFRELAAGGEFELLTKKAVQAGPDERQGNPRARSARLRVLRRRRGEELAAAAARRSGRGGR